jgi:hypothetical protein
MCFRAMQSRSGSSDHGPAQLSELPLKLGQSYHISTAFRRMHLLLQALKLRLDPAPLYGTKAIIDLPLYLFIAQRI